MPIGQKSGGRRGSSDRRGRRPGGRDQGPELEQRVIDIARVTRVMAGGKRMRFRATVIVGDPAKHTVGMGVAKGADVAAAVGKAVNQASKKLRTVTVIDGTIPHRIRHKSGAAVVLLKPAPTGTGVIAGGAVRNVLEVAGVPDVVAKILGTRSKLNNVRATLGALEELQHPEEAKERRGVSSKKKAAKKAGPAKA